MSAREGSLGSFTAVANGTGQSIRDLKTVNCAVLGTFVATVKIQVSYDGGTTWVEFASVTAPGVTAVLPQCGMVRATCSAFTSGQADVFVAGERRTGV